ncbi:response regulator [Alkalimonas sp. MEB108]|uniref:Response regulator n=2 Tax=Alkalimonas cellulosilytica TaxID=3058395 RepID=A0ABU7J5S7_9GAMM|nr:response regulator [Alkalimonas sp. MEB108]MEE2001357.1 response regulator [Alkalimonas sp. MEB108]
MNERILVVDDETPIRRMLKIALASDGYQVIEADSGEQGLVQAARQQPALMILDLGLPDMEGHQVLLQLRQWSEMPVIVLSVRNQDKEKVRALDQGAQDYVTKPFSVEELLARVRACLRDQRRDRQQTNEFSDGTLCINLPQRLVTLDGQRVELTPKEYAVLSRLVQANQCVVTQTELLKAIWGPSHQDDTHYLRIVISHLRQKLGDDPASPKYIQTEAGVGYRFFI